MPTMTAVLRLSLLILWVCCAYAQPWNQRPRYQSGHHAYRPHTHTYHYNYPRYQTNQRSPCTAETPCYKRLLTFTSDAVPDTRPNPRAFINHHKRAGLDRYGIIVEGKRAAQFFRHQHGVDLGNIPDESYLAPNITLPNGIRFSYETIGSAGNAFINMASQGPAVQFINTPVSIAEWTLSFPVDYYSNGAYKGNIPAGSGSLFGSLIFDTCPDESWYNPCRSTLSRQRKGRVVIKFSSRTFYTPGILDCNLVHDQWGQGHVIGADVATEADGVLHSRGILTFPASCDSSVKCFTNTPY